MAHETLQQDPRLTAYAAFVDKLDAHARRVEERWRGRLACASGCSGCCHRELTVFPIEAAAIEAFLTSESIDLSPAPRPALTSEALQVLDLDGAAPCAMLDGDGRCRIYPVRPVICRTHGLPLAVVEENEAGEAEVYGDVCPLSFEGGDGLVEVPSEDFLALETVNTVLVALNAQFPGGGDGRVGLRSLAEERP